MAGIALCRTTCRKIHDLLLDLPGVKPRPSAASFWVSVVGRPINRLASLSPLKMIEKNKNDFLWLIIHRAICVRCAFKVWGFEIKSDKCGFGSRVETIDHCFYLCPRAHRVWNFFSPALSWLLNYHFPVSVPSLFFPFSDVQSSPLVFFVLLSLGKNYLLGLACS